MSVGPHPNGKRNHWIIDCRPGGYKGKRERIPFQGKEVEAIAAELDLMRSTKDPINIIAPKISDLYPEWIAYYKNEVARSTLLDAITCYKKLLPFFGNLRPNLLTTSILDQYKAERLKTVKKRTINKELVYLSRLIKWAVSRRYIVKPAIEIKGFPAKQTKAKRPRPLSPEEINRVYNAIEPKYKLVLLLMCDGGLRRNEALHLRAEDINMQRGLISVTGKGNKQGIIPILTDRLFEEIACKIEDTDGYLSVNPRTGKPYYGIRKALVRAGNTAGLPKHLHHHLMRHSFGTIATVSGMHLNAVQTIMRHADPSTTMIYQHLGAEYLKEEGKKFKAP